MAFKILDNELIGMMASELMGIHNKIYTGKPIDHYDMDMLSGIIGILNSNHKN